MTKEKKECSSRYRNKQDDSLLLKPNPNIPCKGNECSPCALNARLPPIATVCFAQNCIINLYSSISSIPLLPFPSSSMLYQSKSLPSVPSMVVCKVNPRRRRLPSMPWYPDV